MLKEKKKETEPLAWMAALVLHNWPCVVYMYLAACHGYAVLCASSSRSALTYGFQTRNRLTHETASTGPSGLDWHVQWFKT